MILCNIWKLKCCRKSGWHWNLYQKDSENRESNKRTFVGNHRLINDKWHSDRIPFLQPHNKDLKYCCYEIFGHKDIAKSFRFLHHVQATALAGYVRITPNKCFWNPNQCDVSGGQRSCYGLGPRAYETKRFHGVSHTCYDIVNSTVLSRMGTCSGAAIYTPKNNVKLESNVKHWGINLGPFTDFRTCSGEVWSSRQPFCIFVRFLIGMCPRIG